MLKRSFQWMMIPSFALSCLVTTASAQPGDFNGCGVLPDYATLQSALTKPLAAESGGLHSQMWATIVDRNGNVCAVAFTGIDRGAQWPGSRVISAQKANTANAFSLDRVAPAMEPDK
jgi:hypothetical protein